ncbi:MAG TPA: VIT1/CCC1 transporter family protein, partial [Candidatus Nitrosocosmicus sp.]|nr:VIT1/CCC1 transporter family protein [Candidatus Nitrosocosmicus sp.]
MPHYISNREYKNLKKHLAQEHKISPLSTYLKEIVYGGNDGIVTTFAVIAGFTGAQHMGNSSLPFVTVILFGLANLFADATSMALGNFLSIRSEQDVYKSEKAKELREIQGNLNMEKEETIEILQMKGFSEEQAKDLTAIYATNKDYWVDFMMSKELEISNPENDNPVLTGFATFVSFLFFGFIPLIPYIFFRDIPNIFITSVAFTLFSLVLLGVLRYKVTKLHIIR